MEYTQLRQNLEKILNDDMHNRVSLQEMRRDVFLNTENLQRVQQTIEEKDKMIVGLKSEGEKEQQKISQLSAELEELKNLMEWERAQHLQEKENFVNDLLKKDEELLKLKSDSELNSKNNAELTRLSIQNDEYASKIRELIYYIDGLNGQLELSKQINNDKEILSSEVLKLKSEMDLISEKLATAGERNELLNAQCAELQILLDAANQENNWVKNDVAELKSTYDETLQNWIQQKQLVDEDNVALSGANELLKLEVADTLIKYNSAVSEIERLQNSLHETEALFTEKNNIENTQNEELKDTISKLQNELEELNALSQKQIEKSSTELRQLTSFYENQVAQLKSEIDVLKLDYSNIEFERAQLHVKLEDLNIQLNESKSVEQNEGKSDEFIDKLFLQIDELTSAKQTLTDELESKIIQMGDLQNKLAEFRETIGNQNIAIQNLEKQRNQINLAETLFPGMEPEAVKNKIDELVREIDRCLSLLNA